ncbi:hypothetical protein D9M68_951030 [compost metagenome]
MAGLAEKTARALPHQAMYLPPLIDSVMPLMNADSSATRNTTPRAISGGVAKRPAGIAARMRAIASGGTASTMAVSV